jgi:membrane-associated protease RseP (regulator of RpoE activity)
VSAIRVLPVVSLVLFAVLFQLQGCASVTTRPAIDPSLTAREADVQRRLAVEERTRLLDRLTRVSLPVLVNGVPLCGDKVDWYLGMDTASEDNFNAEWRQAHREVLGVNEYVTVTRVYDNTPAQAAGLRRGDRILMLNGEKVEPGEDCYADYLKRVTELSKDGRPLTLWIERDGLPLMVQVTPARLCGYPVLMDNTDVINAVANGEVVIMNKGIINFVESDEELALIVGHELAHNTMGHIEKTSGNRMMGAILDGVIAGLTGVYTNAFANAATLAYSQEFEQEADYVGMYFIERAGYDSTNAPKLWRRMAANNPYGISHATTHPTTAARAVFLEECVKEIKAKKAAGQELLPEFSQAQ